MVTEDIIYAKECSTKYVAVFFFIIIRNSAEVEKLCRYQVGAYDWVCSENILLDITVFLSNTIFGKCFMPARQNMLWGTRGGNIL